MARPPSPQLLLLSGAVDHFDADHEEAREKKGSGGKEGRQSGFGGSSDNRHKYSRGFSDLYFARISHLICMENLVVRDAAFAPSFSTAYTYTRIPVIARTAATTTTNDGGSSSSQTR